MNEEIHNLILKINKTFKIHSNVVLDVNKKNDDVYYFIVEPNKDFKEIKLYIYHCLHNHRYNEMRIMSFLDGFYWGTLFGKKLSREKNEK